MRTVTNCGFVLRSSFQLCRRRLWLHRPVSCNGSGLLDQYAIVRISPVEEWKPTAFEMLFSILPYSTFYLPYLKGVLWFILQDMKFILKYRTVWLVLFGTDSSAAVVPIGAIRWYRFIRYSGTDSPILSANL